MKQLLIDLMWCHLRGLGMFAAAQDTCTASRTRAGILPVHTPWMNETLRVFEKQGYLRRDGDAFTLVAPPEVRPEALWAQWEREKQHWLDNPDLRAQMVLLDLALRALPDVLTGRTLATQVIFPESSLRLVENIYKHNPMADYFNQALASRVQAHVARTARQNPSARLRIIEIGAGTGATSAVVLSRLAGLHHAIGEYCYTDLSKAFLSHAEQTYGPANPFLSYGILNVEKPLAEQGVDIGGYDVVIAANVLHATRNMRTTMRRAKSLLKRNGLIFLNELTTHNLFNHLTFGLLEGWWLYEDGELRIPGSPGLLPETWRQVLTEVGFHGIGFPCPDALGLGQQIIIAESDGRIDEPVSAATVAAATASAGVTVPRVAAVAEPGRPPVPRLDEARRHVEQVLFDTLASALRIDRHRIERDQPFSRYGLDSIIAVNLTRSINDTLDVDLDITALFEHNTFDALLAQVLALRPSMPETMAASQRPADAAPSPADAVAAAGAVARVDRVLLEILSEALRIPREKIDASEPFSRYGLDSIIAVNVTRQINERLQIDLDITVMFEHGSLRALSDFIAEQYPRLAADDTAGHRASAVREGMPAPEPASAAPAPAAGAPSVQPREVSAPASASASASAASVCGAAVTAVGALDVAIVGIHSRFPGDEGIDAFWETMRDHRSRITPPPSDRVDWQVARETWPPEAFDGVWGGFLDGIHAFDPLFFGIAPSEAAQTTPEQRLLLMSVWNALEDAGYTPRALSGAPTGVFIATGASEYAVADAGAEGAPVVLAAPSLSLIPNRISYLLNLQGPSEYCETTCSSSLVALHRAVQSIRLGECRQAIVGGVNLILSPQGYLGMAAANMLSRDGQVRPFQPEAAGTVRSEGVCTLLIKPLHQALDDGDHVYAVIKGTAVAHGGRGVSLTAPNVQGMKTAMLQAYRQAGVDPSTVSYIEAHGMATALADGAEIAAFKSALQTMSEQPASGSASLTREPVRIGTLKPCIGHAEVVSGMAALVKVVQAMRHRTIPGIPQFTGLHEAMSLAGSPFEMSVGNRDWEPRLGADGRLLPRRASINSYGIGGVNAHAVIEAWEPQADAHADMHVSRAGDPHAGPHLILLSARDPDSLTARIHDLLACLERSPATALADIEYTLQTGREHMPYRWAAVVRDREALLSALQDAVRTPGDSAEATPEDRLVFTGEDADRSVELAQIFSGRPGEVLTSALFAEGRLEDLARYWVKGAGIPWEAARPVPGDDVRALRRVSLPAYPFKRAATLWRGQVMPAASAVAPAASTVSAVPVPASESMDDDEARLQAVMVAVLGLAPQDWNPDRPLSDYGLNSLLLITMVNNIRTHYPEFQADWIKPQSTAREVVRCLARLREAPASPPRNVVRLAQVFPELIRLNDRAQGRPVFWVHGALGSVEAYQALADRSDRPFYALQARGFMTGHAPVQGIEAMAAYYIQAIQSVQPHGPYDIGGFCLGGILAYEMTRQLQGRGESVDTLVMIDSPDNSGFRSAAPENIGAKDAALQVVNTLLWPPGPFDPAVLETRMIAQDAVDTGMTDDAFIHRLAELAIERGLGMRQDKLEAFIRQNIEVQVSYRLHEFEIRPLSGPESVECRYFRNRNGFFYGDLARYFIASSGGFSLDHVVYWEDWRRELERFEMIDIDASNHMTILFEEASLDPILSVCAELYAADASVEDRRAGVGA